MCAEIGDVGPVIRTEDTMCAETSVPGIEYMVSSPIPKVPSIEVIQLD